MFVAQAYNAPEARTAPLNAVTFHQAWTSAGCAVLRRQPSQKLCWPLREQSLASTRQRVRYRAAICV